MTIKQWGGTALLPAFLIACAGGAGEEINHEKTDSTESAALAGWEIQSASVQSDHNLGNNLKVVFDVDAPDTARKFRLRFARIDMEQSYDFLVIQDGSGNELERVTGRHRNYVSRTINGKTAKIVLETDYSVSSWGFTLDQIRHRGCARADPSLTPMRAARNCTDLKDSIAELAINQVRRRFTEGHFGGPIFLRSATTEAATPAPAPAHSETNTQVIGVDEADIIKTNGNYIYAIAGRQLRVFKSWPAADTTLETAVDIEGWPRELFLDEQAGRLIVFSGVQSDTWFPGPVLPIARIAPIWWQPDAYTKVTVFDVVGGTPRMTSETLIAGQYQSARRIGDSVRLVQRRQLKWPQIQYYPENVEWNSAEFDRAMDELEETAVQTIERRPLADWLPVSYRVVNGQRRPIQIDCTDFEVQTSGDELGLTSVVTINVGTTTPTIQDTSLLVDSNVLYQSTENLYFTTNHQWSCYEDSGARGQFTYVHKLDISNPSKSQYLATGGFEGSILNQFALDEHGSYLRVASTNSRWQAATPEERSVSRVYVLGQSNRRGRLEIVGQTPDMAPGERIFSSRFVGDKGFVVTFRQVDPLFTLDLSNPANPTIVGELKIPGFSTYLHVLDDDHLFAVGNDFEEDGRTRNGVALTIFDVSDLAAPRLKHKAVVGTSHGHSEALYDHRAFTIYTEPGASNPVVAIPFTDWDKSEDDANYWGTFVSSLKVFRVSPLGILGLGEIDHKGLFEGNETNRWGWWYRPNVRRGVFVDQYVYAVSDAGLRVAPIADLTNIIAEVSAEPQYQTPTTPTVETEEVSAKPALSIPDNNRTGVSTTIEMTKDIEVTSLSVEVDIKHTYKGDLVVTVEHNGTTEILHDKTGGSGDDVKRTFETERFKGSNSKGTWTLKVVDTARLDVGTINNWKITARGKATTGGGTTTPTQIDATYSNNQKVDIPDNSSRGITSDIEVPQGVRIETLEVQLNIRHTYRGDLRVVLEHDGKQVVLHAQAGGSANDLVQKYDVDDFNGTDGRGTWTLRVSDNARIDVGTLNEWSVKVTGEAL